MCAPPTPHKVIVLLPITAVLIPKYPPDHHQVIVLLLTTVLIPHSPTGSLVSNVIYGSKVMLAWKLS